MEHEKKFQRELQLLIDVATDLIKAANNATLCPSECLSLGRLAHKLRYIIQIISSSSCIDHGLPWLRRFSTTASYNLNSGLNHVRKCKPSLVLRYVFFTSTPSPMEFDRISNLLKASIEDFRWLLSVFSDKDGVGAELISKLVEKKIKEGGAAVMPAA